MSILNEKGEEYFYEHKIRTGTYPNIGYIVPYYYRNKWFMSDNDVHVPLTEVARRCKIDHETATMLKLKYGG
jgi:hypothetical protein